jgi:hypothetical protein
MFDAIQDIHTLRYLLIIFLIIGRHACPIYIYIKIYFIFSAYDLRTKKYLTCGSLLMSLKNVVFSERSEAERRAKARVLGRQK